MPSRHAFEVRQLDHIGAEIVGLDLEREIDADTARQLNDVWLDHGVLVFRGAASDVAVHLRASRLFGELAEHVVESLRVDGTPELIMLGGEGEKKGSAMVVDGEIRAGFLFLHQDGAFTPSIAKGSMLRMIKRPHAGGDTIWVDTQKAYDELPADLKDFCDDHATVQIYRDLPDRLWGWPDMQVRAARPEEGPTVDLVRNDRPPVLQPMVITHPVTGRRSLLTSPLGFVCVHGIDRATGDQVYERVARHLAQPRFAYRHRWSIDDLVLWDNRRTMHWALGYPYDGERVVQRTTLVGDLPTGRYLEPAEAAALAIG
jgi:taurine dioxygenase